MHLNTNATSAIKTRPRVEAIDSKRRTEPNISPEQRRGLYVSVMIRDESPATVARRADITFRDLVFALVEETEQQYEESARRRRRAELPRFGPSRAA